MWKNWVAANKVTYCWVALYKVIYLLIIFPRTLKRKVFSHFSPKHIIPRLLKILTFLERLPPLHPSPQFCKKRPKGNSLNAVHNKRVLS